MATPGVFADLFSKEFGVARGTVQARGHDARREGLLPPAGARGLQTADMEGKPLVDWMMAVALEDAAAVAETRASRRDDDSKIISRLFAGLTITDAENLGDALDSLLADAVSGTLQKWRAR